MSWFKQILGSVVTIVGLTIAGSISFGRLSSRQEDLVADVQAKADKEAVEREMDQLQSHLARIELKIDQVILGMKK